MDEKCIAFISKLCQSTKDKITEWCYLEDEATLCANMDWRVENINPLLSALSGSCFTKHFDGDNSFVSKIDDTFVVLLKVSDEALPTLYVVPKTYRSYRRFKPDEYGEYITRLHNLVKSQFPSADAFIDNFLKD